MKNKGTAASGGKWDKKNPPETVRKMGKDTGNNNTEGKAERGVASGIQCFRIRDSGAHCCWSIDRDAQYCPRLRKQCAQCCRNMNSGSQGFPVLTSGAQYCRNMDSGAKRYRMSTSRKRPIVISKRERGGKESSVGQWRLKSDNCACVQEEEKTEITKCQCLLAVAASIPGQHFCATPWPTDISHGKVIRRCLGATGTETWLHAQLLLPFLENKTMLKAPHLQKCSPASSRTLGSLEWSKKMVHTLGSRRLSHLYKPCQKGPKSSVHPRCSATAVTFILLTHTFSGPPGIFSLDPGCAYLPKTKATVTNLECLEYSSHKKRL